MIHYEWYESGKIFGLTYLFTERGDCLPNHCHGIKESHNVIVLEGSVLFVPENGQKEKLFPGTIFDFDWSIRHTIVALEMGTKILNLFLQGIPEEYKTLPTSEKSGKFEQKCLKEIYE